MNSPDLFLIFICVLLGWNLHNFYITWKMTSIIRKIHDLHDLQTTFKDDEGETQVAEHVQLDVVVEQGIYLVYDEDNNFVCQGNTLEEVAQKFKERTDNVLGEFRIDDKINCFFNGKHYDHNKVNKIVG